MPSDSTAHHAPAPPPIAFAGGTLDRAAHLRDAVHAERLRRQDTARAVLIGADQQIALDGTGALALVPARALPADAQLTFLGLERSGAARFAYDAAGETREPHRMAPLRQLAAELETAGAALAAYAAGMVGWHRVHRHCGRCGHATEVEAAGHRRRCPSCGLLQFPRTDPAVTMLVQSGERCLLSRRRGAPERRWSALAGFVEPGETPEEAVAREAREETGVEVVGVEYVAAQPWPFPAALMIGFWAFADPAGAGDGGAAGAEADELAPQADELLDARWFERGELAAAIRNGRIVPPPHGTIGNYLISTWLASR